MDYEPKYIFLITRLDKHAEKKTEQFYFSQGK